MKIPRYQDKRPLDIADKPMLDDIFARLQPRISEFTFANLYLFRKAHSYTLTLVGDALVVLGRGYDGQAYFLPPLCGGIGPALDILLADGHTLFGADEEFIREYLEGRDELRIVEDRNAFDYLYLRRELAELPGNRFHKKKNRVKYFLNRHSCIVEPYSDKHLEGSLRLLQEWSRIRMEIDSTSILPETEATAEALRMAKILGLQGQVILVDGEVKAFALGEKLNDTTSVCHFEKADPFLEGIYQLIDREFCRLCFVECTHVNREQDLGEENLRAAKMSYHPVELVKKYRVRVR